MVKENELIKLYIAKVGFIIILPLLRNQWDATSYLGKSNS